MTWKFVILCKRVFGADDRYDIWTTRTENRQGSTKKAKKFHKATTEAFSSGACYTDKYVNKTEEDITSNSKRGNLWNLP